MLAHFQKALTIGAFLIASVFVWAGWNEGHSILGFIAAAAVLGAYAVVLALEFALLAHVHGDDPTPPATLRQLVRAWWGEVLAAPRVFCWRQPFRSRAWPDLLLTCNGGRRGVLLVHGFFCNRGVWNRWLQRLSVLGVPTIAVNLVPTFGSIEAYAWKIEEAIQALERHTGMPPVAVAHSMGGLAVRSWCSRPGNEGRLKQAITIGTPHRGTWLARFALTMNSRQMRQSSAWLDALAIDEQLGQRGRAIGGAACAKICFYSHCDNIVFPASAGTLPCSDNRHLEGVAHMHMVDRPEPWEALLKALELPQPQAKA